VDLHWTQFSNLRRQHLALVDWNNNFRSRQQMFCVTRSMPNSIKTNKITHIKTCTQQFDQSQDIMKSHSWTQFSRFKRQQCHALLDVCVLNTISKFNRVNAAIETIKVACIKARTQLVRRVIILIASWCKMTFANVESQGGNNLQARQTKTYTSPDLCMQQSRKEY